MKSKTIESLRRFPSKDDILHDQIADTYFYQKSRKKRTGAPPKKIQINFAAASLFAVIAFLIAGAPALNRYYLDSLRQQVNGAKEVRIVEEGRLKTLAIKKAAFRGRAKGGYARAESYIVLDTAKKYNWVEAAFDFKFPIDLAKRKITISMRGDIGGERVNVILRDSKRKSVRLRDMYLTPHWKTETITLTAAGDDLDVSQVTHLRLECGYPGESGSEPDPGLGITVYLQDLRLIREG